MTSEFQNIVIRYLKTVELTFQFSFKSPENFFIVRSLFSVCMNGETLKAPEKHRRRCICVDVYVEVSFFFFE